MRLGIGEDLGLDVAAEQVVRGLQGFGRHGDPEGLHLPGVEVRHAGVPDLALGDQPGERLRGLIKGRAGIGPVHLVQVDVVGAERPQAGVDALPDPAGACVTNQAAVSGPQSALGGDDDPLTGDTTQRGGQELLGLPEAVGLGRVEEGDTLVDSPPDGSHRLTERLARAAIEAGAGFEARLMAAEAAHLQGRSDQAEQELAALAALATSDAEKARVALLRFDNTYFERSADFQIIDDTLADITDPFWRDALVNRRLFVMAMSSRPREIAKAASTWIQRPDSASRVEVLHAMVRMGRFDEAIERLTPPPDTRAVPAPDELWHQWILFGCRPVALVYSGRLVEAGELLTMAYREVMDHPAAEARAVVAAWFALLHLEQGRPVSAFRRASESYTLLQQLGRSSVVQRPYAVAAHALALTGRAEQAAATLSAVDALAVPIWPSIRTDLLQARAWAAAAAGDLATARARLEEATDAGEEIGDLIGAASALHGLARLGHARQVAGHLEDLAAQVDGERGGPRRLCQRGGGERRPGSPCGLRSLRGPGALLYAAEASVETAAASRRGGRPRDAAADEHRAAQLLSRCEGAATPVVRTITARARLTPGELDAAVERRRPFEQANCR